MTQPAASPELTCPTCGSPVPTTAPPGTRLTCNCCGAAVTVPEPPPAPEAGQPVTND